MRIHKVKNKQEEYNADSNSKSQTPEIDDTYDNPVTVEKVNNHDKLKILTSIIQFHKRS